MTSVDEILDVLRERATTKNLESMSKFGIAVHQRLGVSVPEMRKIAKRVGTNHRLALALWNTGIAEAKIVASMIDDPALVTEAQAEKWVRGIDSWDVCDHVCGNLFDRSPWAWRKVPEWAKRDEEFVKRAAFALVAYLAWHDKDAKDQRFLRFFQVLKRGATDERNFVRKAVSWAIRNIGKRNLELNRAAIRLAQDIRGLDTRPARWIASDVIRELESDAVQARLNP